MVASCERGSTAAMTMGGHSELNSTSIRKMLRPVHTAPDSPVTSPENTRGHLKVRNSIYIYIGVYLYLGILFLVELKSGIIHSFLFVHH